jgi:hypothetical protein
MTEKTLRSEYPITSFGDRVVAIARAVTSLPGRKEPGFGAYEPWALLSLPAQIAGFEGQPMFMFCATCAYHGAQPGTVLLAVTEEQMRQASPPFQQCFVAFLDCDRELPASLNPFELLDPFTRRNFVRDPMWSVAPATALVAETLNAIAQSWAVVGKGSLNVLPTFQWVSGGEDMF